MFCGDSGGMTTVYSVHIVYAKLLTIQQLNVYGRTAIKNLKLTVRECTYLY